MKSFQYFHYYYYGLFLFFILIIGENQIGISMFIFETSEKKLIFIQANVVLKQTKNVLHKISA
jgi:hypothetical protein